MHYADIHIHGLWNCDDGPRDENAALDMIADAYADGVRVLCMTPHFHLGYFGDNRASSERAFARLQERCSQRYPDLKLYLGNELRWCEESIQWLNEDLCRTINGSRYVLVDFLHGTPERTIVSALESLLNAGYLPVLAHVERYRNLRGRLELIRFLRDDGVVIQVDSQALTGECGMGERIWAWKIVRAGCADLVCSDAHDCTRRPPGLDRVYRMLKKKVGEEYARSLCRECALWLLRQNEEGKDGKKTDG